MATLFSGKEVAAAMELDLSERVQACVRAGVQPTLAVLRVGENQNDLSYERGVMKRARAIGLSVAPFVFPEDVSQAELEEAITCINADDSIHGCLMFRPLPVHLNEAALCDMLAVEKDVDGISSASMAAVYSDAPWGFAPSTAAACIKILDHYGVELAGKRVVVLGRSLVVGKPVAMLALARNATPVICHSKTLDPAACTREADIVICATGRARAYGAEYFSAKQIVLDVGINFMDGKLCGDADFESVEAVVGAITPVPGGVGSVTSSITLEHTVKAAERTLR